MSGHEEHNPESQCEIAYEHGRCDRPVARFQSGSNTLFANSSLRLVNAKAELRHGVSIVKGEFGLDRQLLSGHDGRDGKKS